MTWFRSSIFNDSSLLNTVSEFIDVKIDLITEIFFALIYVKTANLIQQGEKKLESEKKL